jgi:hypothetical protein
MVYRYGLCVSLCMRWGSESMKRMGIKQEMRWVAEGDAMLDGDYLWLTVVRGEEGPGHRARSIERPNQTAAPPTKHRHPTLIGFRTACTQTMQR